ncbi:MAG TPA: acyl-CoA dehydrogenase family protein [Acidimicrobiales bacterium]|nr:acyl-CoA dehydrogenase family protein [Acidimicrobiales bacterium]
MATENPLLAAARGLGPTIRAAAEQTEQQRCLPAEVVQAMTEAGLFGMAVAAARGGPELDPVGQIDVIEEVAFSDGSTGWCLMIGCDTGYWSAWVSDDAADGLWADNPLGPSAIVLAPGGTGVAVDGGYRVSGRWPFGSGRAHCDVVGAGFLVTGADGGFVLGDDGMPVWRIAFVPVAESTTVDTWHTTGLAGTASNDFTLDGVFVAQERTCDLRGTSQRSEPLYAVGNFFLSKMGAVPLGIARRALEEFVTLAGTKVQMPAMNHLRDEPFVQVSVADADARLGAARAWLRQVTGEVYAAVSTGEQPSLALRGRLRMAVTHAAHTSKDVAGLVYELAGGGAVYKPGIFDRCLRDVTTACQHIVLQRKNTAAFGRALLGLEPEALFV